MTAAGAAAGFAGSVARQYISEGKVSYKSAAKDGIINGLGTLGFSVGGKALGAAGRYLSETKAVERVKGVVLDGLSSNSESLAAINKKIGSSMQGLMEKIKLPESKLAFETGNSSLGKSTYSSAIEYADKNVMDNFNKVYANREEIQTAVKAAQGSVDEIGESAVIELSKPLNTEEIISTTEKVNSNGSRLKYGAEHGRNNVYHNNAIEAELDRAAEKGADLYSIRKNRFQVDANGKVVKASTQRKADASYVIDSERYNTNYVSNYNLDDTTALNYELDAFNDMCKADPTAHNTLVFQYGKIKYIKK